MVKEVQSLKKAMSKMRLMKTKSVTNRATRSNAKARAQAVYSENSYLQEKRSGAFGKAKDKFAAAIIDPFLESATGAGIPIENAGPSYKVAAFQRVTVTVGTTGCAQVAILPTCCNDLDAIIYSGSTFAGTHVSTNTAHTGLSEARFANLPFTSAQLVGSNTQVSGRVVSCGWRVTYNGSVLNRAGELYSFVSADRELVDGSNSGSGIAFGTQSTCSVFPMNAITREPFTEVQCGLNSKEFEYSNRNTDQAVLQQYPYCGGNAISGTVLPATAVLWVEGATPGTTLQFECRIIVEYIGRLAAPFVTPSENDVVGYNQVMTVAGHMPQRMAANPRISRRESSQAFIRSVGIKLGAFMLKSAASRIGVGDILSEFL